MVENLTGIVIVERGVDLADAAKDRGERLVVVHVCGGAVVQIGRALCSRQALGFTTQADIVVVEIVKSVDMRVDPLDRAAHHNAVLVVLPVVVIGNFLDRDNSRTRRRREIWIGR